MKNLILLLTLVVSFFPAAGWAKLPACMDKKDRLEFNENQVLTWRDYEQKKFTARAFVKGLLVRVMEDRQKHIHFEVDFDNDLSTSDDRIEVIYNTEFGPLPDYRPGDEIVACGDFVVDPYSKFKGVVHWLHMSPKLKAHDHGYLAINGVVTGQINPKPEVH